MCKKLEKKLLGPYISDNINPIFLELKSNLSFLACSISAPEKNL